MEMADGQETASNKPSKRWLTDTRREQNRAAAKAYRRRQKEMAQSLLHQSRNKLDKRREILPLQPRGVPDAVQLENAISHSNGPAVEINPSEIPTNPGLEDIHYTELQILESFQTPPNDNSTSNYTRRPQSDSSVPSDMSLVDLNCSSKVKNSTLIQTSLLFPLSAQGPPGTQSGFSESFDFQFGASVMNQSLDLVLPPSLYFSYSNCIQPSKTSTLKAFLFHTYLLGIAAEDFLISCMTIGSPFYCPTAMTNDPRDILAKSVIPSLPDHLQPTLPQILYSHHAYLDLIPFPVLRERVISHSSSTPPIFDLQQFKQDLFNGGIVYWPTENSSELEPDPQRFEATPWFRRKWRMLIDGEDGYIWKQSLFWEMVRRGLESNV